MTAQVNVRVHDGTSEAAWIVARKIAKEEPCSAVILRCPDDWSYGDEQARWRRLSRRIRHELGKGETGLLGSSFYPGHRVVVLTKAAADRWIHEFELRAATYGYAVQETWSSASAGGASVVPQPERSVAPDRDVMLCAICSEPLNGAILNEDNKWVHPECEDNAEWNEESL